MIPAAIYDNTLRGLLAPIGPFLDDASVTEVLVNGPQQIFIEKKGRLVRTNAAFPSEDRLLSALRLVAQFAGRALDDAHPILEARLPDGSRVEAMLPPISPDGPSLAIRRFSKERLTIGKLLEFGALTLDAAETLRVLVECKQNIVVAGGTGSGKTSLLNALSAFIPAEERILVIEDARELQIQHQHVLQLEARPPDARGVGAVTVRDIFRASLRMRPDRIILGEIRAGEALDLVQAMTSGHGGCLATVHASYPIDTLNRLETMALMSGVELPLLALRAQLASAVDIVVQTTRLRDGRRAVSHITEITGLDPVHGYRLKDLFIGLPSQPGADGRFTFNLEPTGVLPDCLSTIHAHGIDLPKGVHETARRARAGAHP